MARASAAGRRVAEAARKEFEESGIPAEQLKRCDAEGTDGTQFAHCVKVYLPAAAGPHGMVLRIARRFPATRQTGRPAGAPVPS